MMPICISEPECSPFTNCKDGVWFNFKIQREVCPHNACVFSHVPTTAVCFHMSPQQLCVFTCPHNSCVFSHVPTTAVCFHMSPQQLCVFTCPHAHSLLCVQSVRTSCAWLCVCVSLIDGGRCRVKTSSRQAGLCGDGGGGGVGGGGGGFKRSLQCCSFCVC